MKSLKIIGIPCLEICKFDITAGREVEHDVDKCLKQQLVEWHAGKLIHVSSKVS